MICASILSEIVKTIKGLNEKQTLYVLKGFNFISDQLEQLNFLFLKNEIITEINFDPRSNLRKLSSDDRSFFAWYEDLIFLDINQKIGGVKDFTNYTIKIIENDLFFNYYPDFNSVNVGDKYLKYNADTDNIVQLYYGDIAIDNNQAFVVYNDVSDKEITKIKISELLPTNFVGSDGEIVEMPEESDNISFAVLVKEIISKNVTEIKILKTSDSQDVKIRNLTKLLKSLGVKISTRKYSTSIYKVDDTDYGQYEAILKRKNDNFKFKDLKIYKDPYEGNELINISQSVIVDKIVKNVELAQREESFRDIFVTAPTGSGKSVMFQIPAVYIAEKYDLLTIVVTPLIGLMNDQVVNIKALTEKAATINSDYTPIEKEQTLERVKSGEVSILYLSPESLLSNTDITNLIGERKIGLVVVDESHIVATWGKSFRPDYWYLGDFIAKLRNSEKSDHHFPIATFTATSTFGGDDNMYSDIVESLKMTAEKFIGNVKRDDIVFNIRHHTKDHAYKEEKIETAAKEINKLQKTKDKTLVYVPYTSHIADLMAKMDDKTKVGKYYGGMPAGEKNETLEKIKTGEENVVLATKAFGMGIDIDDIKNVYHFAPTGNIADYVQEIGRAARKNGMTGVAATDFYKEDFRYINQLYGMSSIKHWQIIAVLEKIFDIYRRKNKRNLLVSPMEFSYIFNDVPPHGIDAKLKTALLIIKKDFEMQSRSNYIPLIFKPRSMFANGYFMVNDEMIDILKQFGVWQFFKKLNLPRKIETISSGVPMTVSSPGDTFALDFKKLWESKYKDMSFASFKHNFFSNDLDKDFKVGKKLIARSIIQIDGGGVKFSEINNRLATTLNDLQSIFGDLRQNNKHFAVKELAKHIREKTTVKKPYIADMLAQSIIHILNRVPINSFNQSPFATYNSQTDKWNIQNTTYETRIKRIIGYAHRSLSPESTQTVRFTGADLKDNLDLLLAQLLEILELADVKISAGNNPEFFIRINNPSAIEKIVRNKSYKSKTVSLVDYKHKESCRLMEKFFTELTSDEDRWNFIEQYFLGRTKISSAES